LSGIRSRGCAFAQHDQPVEPQRLAGVEGEVVGTGTRVDVGDDGAARLQRAVGIAEFQPRRLAPGGVDFQQVVDVAADGLVGSVVMQAPRRSRAGGNR
jgi:hypothetical protein